MSETRQTKLRERKDNHPHPPTEVVLQSYSGFLPDPGIPVFIRTLEGHPSHNKVAALTPERDMFAIASFSHGMVVGHVSLKDITGWDFALPAGDLL